MRCWSCGIEPDRLIDVTTLSQAEPEYLPVWPANDDHEHAERSPSPAQLEQAGHEALQRIRRQALA